jgi:pimeloyl-ACP methyl ester carboxylesterase
MALPFADIRGARLFFTDDGAAESPVVFVHGFSCDSHDWSWQLPHFTGTHRVIALDLRGHGRSSAPESGYQLPSLAADVAELIELVGCGPVAAIGHSLGGAIVATLAVERPDLVRAVVAVDPGHLLPDALGPMLAGAMAAYESGDPGLTARNFFDQASHVPATPAALATWHNRRAEGLPAEVARQTLAGLIGGPSPFALRANSEPYLRRIGCPVLSFFMDPGRSSIADEVFSPPSRSVCFEGSGHWLHQERPAEVNLIMDSWLAGLTGSSPIRS